MKDGTLLKIWTNNKFQGIHPENHHGTAAVVIAENAEEAAYFLSYFLNELGLEDAKVEDMEEVTFRDGEVVILCG